MLPLAVWRAEVEVEMACRLLHLLFSCLYLLFAGVSFLEHVLFSLGADEDEVLHRVSAFSHRSVSMAHGINIDVGMIYAGIHSFIRYQFQVRYWAIIAVWHLLPLFGSRDLVSVRTHMHV